jgi:hypothetical protein
MTQQDTFTAQSDRVVIERAFKDGFDLDVSVRMPDIRVGKPSFYKFEGSYGGHEVVEVEVDKTCGCTSVQPKLEVRPGDKFTIEGTLTARPAPSDYSRTVIMRYRFKPEEQWVRLSLRFMVRAS